MLLRRALLKACEKEERLKWIVEGKEAGKGVRKMQRLKGGKRGKVVWLLLWLRVWPRFVDEVQLCVFVSSG